MGKALLRSSQQIYTVLLKLYPKSHRQEFGEEMEYVFSEQLTDSYTEKGEVGVMALWSRTLIDATKSSIRQHLETQKGGHFMKTNNAVQNSIIRVALVTTGILLIPLLAMQVSSDWNWNVFDFLVMGVLIFSIGLLVEVVRHKVRNTTHRLGLIIALVLLCLYIWAELAVGIFTNLGS